MATTTNYSWTTPDDTALVKDGASAIRSLGTSIDTTTKNLNPSTTLGDIEYRSSISNTNTRLGIGSTGQYLTVSGGVPAWTTLAAGGMTLLSTTALSGTTVTVSSISSAYTDLFILVRGAVHGTAQDDFQFKFNGSTTNIHGINSRNNNGTAGTNVWTDANITTGGTFPLNTGGLNVFGFEIPNYANTSYYKNYNYSWGFQTFSGKNSGTGGGQIATTSAISSFSINTTNLYTFTAGEILVYGVK